MTTGFEDGEAVGHAEEFALTLSLDAEGRLLRAVVPRWGDAREKGRFEFLPFGSQPHADRAFDGYTIAAELGVGWWRGEDRYFEFFPARIESAQFE